MAICEFLRKELQHERIISIPGNSSMEHSMSSIGVDILDSRRVLATTIENLILRPTTYRSLVESFENYLVADIRLANSSIDGKTVKDIPFHRDGMIMLLTRGNDKYVPHGDTYLQEGDVLTVFGTGSAINQIKALLATDND
jgi:CPA2 family monovalent cation:H+ antiporter-2/trk system potassium uptake protein TrkA